MSISAVAYPPTVVRSSSSMAGCAEARFEGSGVSLGVDVDRHAKWIVELLHEVTSSPA